MNQLSLDQARHDVLEDVFGRFDFGDVSVESRNGWEHVSPGSEYSCAVFLENEEGGNTEKVRLNVVFEDIHSTKLKEAYAINDSGNIFGSLPTN